MLDHADRMHEPEPPPKERAADGKFVDAVTTSLSDYVRTAADYTRELADKLEGQKADELVASALTWTRRQPLLLVGGGIVLGIILSQLVRSGRAGTASARSNEASEN
jgi:hypothetical protein